MAMMALLQAPQVDVLGITMVSGNAWEPEEVQHTLRMLELIARSDVPVVPGAIFPLVKTEEEARLDRQRYGGFAWYGAWGDVAEGTSREPHHDAYTIPALAEGAPVHKPLDEDAAHFLVRQVHAHPHKVTIYAAGPLTNVALALAIDPQFAELTEGIVIMGGSLAPQTAQGQAHDPEFATNPRHEFNFWFDPEAAHIVLRAAWPRIDLTTVDVSVKTAFTPAMLKEIASSREPAAQYLARYTSEFYYLWDELAAVAWLDPAVITASEELYVDVDLSRGPTYGDTLSWTEANRPARAARPDLRKVHVQTEVDLPRFYRRFVELMRSPPATGEKQGR